MNAKTVIAAAAVFLSTASAFAAEAPDATAVASAASAARLNLPALNAPSDTSREETKAEAKDVLKDYKTTLSVQLEQYKN